MEMVLTGNMISAQEAESKGLVARVTPDDDVVDEACKMARKISSFSKPIVQIAKECVNASYEMSLNEGVHFERRMFHSTFSTEDRREGMAAFVEKRKPVFKHN